METSPTPPAFPIVEIGGRKLTLKFDFLAKYRMSVLGIGPADLRIFRRSSPGEMDPGVVALAMKLFACAVASNYIDQENPGAPAAIPTPEYWASVIGDDMNRWTELCAATMQALVKALPPVAAPALVAKNEAQPLN